MYIHFSLLFYLILWSSAHKSVDAFVLNHLIWASVEITPESTSDGLFKKKFSRGDTPRHPTAKHAYQHALLCFAGL